MSADDLELPALPGDWTHRAACKRRGAEMVQADARESTGRAHNARAKQICSTCPVLAECRAWALTRPDPASGLIAGGLTVNERKRHRYGLR